MIYFEGIHVQMAERIPRCRAVLNNWTSDFFALNYARSGRIFWAAGRHRRMSIHAPAAWWTWPGQVFSYGADPDSNWDHTYVCFSGERVQRWISGGLFVPDTRKAWAEIEHTRTFSDNFDRLVALFCNPAPDHDAMTHLIEGLLLAATVPRKPSSAHPQIEPIEKLIGDLNADSAIPRDWSPIAASLGLSLVHFRRLFKAATGYPPQQYLIQLRLREAARLLRSTSWPVKQIAGQVGIENEFYLSKLFRSRFGTPPGRYRQVSLLEFRS